MKAPAIGIAFDHVSIKARFTISISFLQSL